MLLRFLDRRTLPQARRPRPHWCPSHGISHQTPQIARRWRIFKIRSASCAACGKPIC